MHYCNNIHRHWQVVIILKSPVAENCVTLISYFSGHPWDATSYIEVACLYSGTCVCGTPDKIYHKYFILIIMSQLIDQKVM